MTIKGYAILCGLAFILGGITSYMVFKRDTKVVVETKEVIKYVKIKGDTITQKPDGTVVITNGTMDTDEHSSSYTKTDINKKWFSLSPVFTAEPELKLYGWGVIFGASLVPTVVGDIGITGGYLRGVTQNSNTVLIGPMITW